MNKEWYFEYDIILKFGLKIVPDQFLKEPSTIMINQKNLEIQSLEARCEDLSINISLSKSESVQFLLIKSPFCIFTDSPVKNIFH